MARSESNSRPTELTTLPILYTTGSYYQVGFNVGSFFADRIKSFFQKSKEVQNNLVPYAASEKGKCYCQNTLKVCQDNFPQYVREIQGIADGSGVPFDDLLLLNLSKEISNILCLEDETGGCTDVMVNSPHTKLMAHNEDCDPMAGPYGYMVSARIVEEGQEMEHFTAFCYPGTLPGCTITVNKHGMVFSINGLYTNYIVHNAPTRMFVNRALLKAKNIEEAQSLMKNTGFGVAYGFCANIGDMKCPSKIWSIEVGPQANESLLHVHTVEEESDPQKPCHYIHYNKYEHLQLPEHFQRSSRAREKAANQLPAPKTQEDMLNILGDTTDELFPLFRSERPSDHSATVLTSVVDILKNRFDIYRGNPSREGAVPLVRLTVWN